MTTFDPLTVTMRLPAQYSSSVAVWAIGSSTSRTMCRGRGNSGAAAWTDEATDRDRTSQTLARVVIKPRLSEKSDLGEIPLAVITRRRTWTRICGVRKIRGMGPWIGRLRAGGAHYTSASRSPSILKSWKVDFYQALARALLPIHNNIAPSAQTIGHTSSENRICCGSFVTKRTSLSFQMSGEPIP